MTDIVEIDDIENQQLIPMHFPQLKELTQYIYNHSTFPEGIAGIIAEYVCDAEFENKLLLQNWFNKNTQLQHSLKQHSALLITFLTIIFSLGIAIGKSEDTNYDGSLTASINFFCTITLCSSIALLASSYIIPYFICKKSEKELAKQLKSPLEHEEDLFMIPNTLKHNTKTASEFSLLLNSSSCFMIYLHLVSSIGSTGFLIISIAAINITRGPKIVEGCAITSSAISLGLAAHGFYAHCENVAKSHYDKKIFSQAKPDYSRLEKWWDMPCC